MVNLAPSLRLSANRINLGDTLGVTGNNFTPGAVVTVRLGPPNAPPCAPVAKAQVNATGSFRVLIRNSRYPSAGARATGMIYVDVAASGAVVGDLPEGVAVPVLIAA